MISFKQEGDFSKTSRFLEKAKGIFHASKFDKYGREGVKALEAATPVRTGLTSESWEYEIEESSSGITISWLNTNINKGVNIAVILQYGHGTGTGGYVRGIDYINPAMRPVFEKIAEDAWREVTG